MLLSIIRISYFEHTQSCHFYYLYFPSPNVPGMLIDQGDMT